MNGKTENHDLQKSNYLPVFISGILEKLVFLPPHDPSIFDLLSSQ